jgi:hypothetical protein
MRISGSLIQTAGSSLFRKVLLLLIILAGIGMGCKREQPENTLFTLLEPADTGIDFENTIVATDSLNILNYIYFYNGGGVGIGDINNDGLDDLFFSGNLVPSKLYLNLGNLKFKDISDEAGILPSGWSTGISMVDINGDGFLDMYVCMAGFPDSTRRANRLYLNNGDLTFTESAQSWGIDHKGYSTHSAFFDYDLDGDLDLYVMNHHIDRTALNTPVPRKLNGESPTTDVLYRNNGDHSFSDVSSEAGITIEGYGLGLGINDLNNDGYPDIYIANDFITNDIMYINNRDGTFSNQIAERITEQSYNGMGVDIADFNNDNQQDILVLDMLPPDPVREKTMAGAMTYDRFNTILRMGYEPQFVRNTLNLNVNGNFREIGRYSGIHRTDWSWAPLFMDADGDGWKDLFITNGYLKDITDKDFMDYENNLGFFKNKEDAEKGTIARIDELPGIKLSNYFYSNDRDLTFTDVTSNWGMDHPSFSNGAAYGDLDNDGDPDLVVNNLNAPAFLFENQGTENHFVKLHLTGPSMNVSAIGSRIRIYSRGTEATYNVNPYRGFMSSMAHDLTVGVGKGTEIDSLRIQWPDGKLSCYHDIQVDQDIEIEYSDNSLCHYSEESLPERSESWDEIKMPGLTLERSDQQFNDFKQQPLLPYKITENYSVLRSGDLNGDGMDDLFVGGVLGTASFIYYQEETGFRRVELKSLIGKHVNEALIADLSVDGMKDLYVACGFHSLKSGDPLQQDHLFLGGPELILSEVLPDIAVNTTTIEVFDPDNDGDPDIVLGTGSYLNNYPESSGLIFLENVDGSYRDVTKDHSISILGGVNDIESMDLDGDGWMDLVVASDWNPVLSLKNREGRFTEKHELGNGEPGFWQSLLVMDMDRDGLDDIIAGNMGMNGPFTANEQEPVSLYLVDFDRNGGYDPLLTYHINGKETLLATRELLFSRYPFFSRKFTSHRSYAEAEIENFLQVDKDSVEHLLVTCLSSRVFINNGNGSFKEQDLPQNLQFSAIKKMLSYSENNQDLLLFLADQDYRFYDGQTFGTGFTPALKLDNGGFSINQPVFDLPLAYSLECITIAKYGICMVYLDKRGDLKLQKSKF